MKTLTILFTSLLTLSFLNTDAQLAFNDYTPENTKEVKKTTAERPSFTTACLINHKPESNYGVAKESQIELITYLANNVSFPDQAREMGKENETCLVKFNISELGQVNNIKVAGCPINLFEAPIKTALEKLEWNAMTRNNIPMDHNVKLNLKFKLNEI